MIDIHPEHARAVLSELAIGMVLLDRDARVSWVNAYAANLLGLPPEKLLGQDIDALSLPYSELGATDTAQVRVDGALIGITQRYEHPSGNGMILMVLDRGHTLVWFLSALSSGVPGAVAASGILSRGATVNRLEAEVSRSRRYANPLSVVSVNLGGIGEAAVSDIARTLKGQLRWVDLLGQWRDEILLVVLPETAAEDAANLAAKLAEAVAERAPSDPAEIHVGCASWAQGDTAADLVGHALQAGRRNPPIRRQLAVRQIRDSQ